MEYLIKRTENSDLAFTGEEVSSTEGVTQEGAAYEKFTLYKTEGGSYVLEWNIEQGENKYTEASVYSSIKELFSESGKQELLKQLLEEIGEAQVEVVK